MLRGRATSVATTNADNRASLGARFAAALEPFSFVPEHSAIGVSGGGDSLALMMLFADWANARNRAKPFVLIVDHGLRQGSTKDAALTQQWGRNAGFCTHVLRWRGRKPQSNVEEEARAARYALMGDWCCANGVRGLFVAHTQDDQAETFLLRLGRGSGVDGLSAMRPSGFLPVPGFERVDLLRPLLAFTRAELRAFLKNRGAKWLEDPMNGDPRFARTRIRTLLPALTAAGVPLSRIAQAAAHLARARQALEAEAERFLAVHARFEEDGAALVDAAALQRSQREIGLRALGQILMRVSGEIYRPRFERLERLFDGITSGTFAKARTLHGCRVGRAPKPKAAFGPLTLVIVRERPRKSASVGSAAVAAGAPSRPNPPQKGRNIPISCNS